MTKKNYRQMQAALEEIRDKSGAMPTGWWASGLAAACLATLDDENEPAEVTVRRDRDLGRF